MGIYLFTPVTEECCKKNPCYTKGSENLSIKNVELINNDYQEETEKEKADRLQRIKNYKEQNTNKKAKPIIVSKKEYEDTKKTDYDSISGLKYENQCEIISDNLEKQINYEKKHFPEKFINITEEEKKDVNNPNFALGILQDSLQDLGIETVIQKQEEDPKLTTKLLDMLVSGTATKKKYEFHYDYGNKKNKDILDNPLEQTNYTTDMKKKYSNLLKIPYTDINIISFNRGSVINHIDFGRELTKEEEELLLKTDPELMELKGTLLLRACRLTPDMLDPQGDNKDGGWADKNAEKRGGLPYDPPHGYIGFGLKVLGKYDKGDDTWLGMKNKPGEYPVAYHGVGSDNPEALKLVGLIAKSNFKPGDRQAYDKYDDVMHPGQKVGKGVYLTPKISVAEYYASKCCKNNGRNYLPIFMCRVKPDEIRYAKEQPDYWVLDPQFIRPYRVLIKEVNQNIF